jgi:hypothetical protein
VAYGSDVYVYVPQYPSQAIEREPALIVPSQPTSPTLRGYIDPRQPHSINNLVVQHLGNDEVVATVRDDGDVDAVLVSASLTLHPVGMSRHALMDTKVRHIVQAIGQRALQDSSIDVVADEVRPIFQSNVGMSAWGLAIHTQARILATSSNAHEVRVFKFGLLHEAHSPEDDAADTAGVAGEGNASSDEQSENMQTSDEEAESHPKRRPMDVTQRVLNGDTNIPYIAFCNTGDDPGARWLLTTDIAGYCRIMDLHRAHAADVTVQQFRFGRSFLGSTAHFDRLNAGWAVMFLDQRSFLPEQSFHAALGLGEDESLPGGRAGNTVWDLSDTVERVSENSEAFAPWLPPSQQEERTQPPGDQQQRVASTDDSQDVEMRDNDAEETQDELASTTVEEIELETSQEPSQESSAAESSGGEDDPSESDIDLDLEDQLMVSDEDPEDEGTEDSLAFNALYGGKRIFGNQPYFYHNVGLCDDLPCPILHASAKNVYLLQPSKQRYSAGSFLPPMVGLANPLRQKLRSQLGYLNQIDRLNMNVYIPSLGVVVLASQKGRALVLSLTKLGASAKYPADMREQSRRTKYAMRVERILPLVSQERQKQRPVAPLHGIAASPIQGAGMKRWRLIMMYQDHSVLSYELSRKQHHRDSGVDLDGLVV